VDPAGDREVAADGQVRHRAADKGDDTAHGVEEEPSRAVSLVGVRVGGCLYVCLCSSAYIYLSVVSWHCALFVLSDSNG
jgi:hypothetical protein